MRQRFAPILDLLDEGLRLYRGSFTRMLLLSMGGALPLGGLAIAFFLSLEQTGIEMSLTLMVLMLVLSLPLTLYVMGALSRAAMMAVAGETVSVRRSLAIAPLRLAGMGCFGTVFLVAASTAVSMVTSVCFCVFYLIIGAGMFAFAAGFASAGALGQAAAVLAIAVSIVAFLLVYAGALVINGAVYGSAVYAMQPFVQEELPIGATVQRSLDLVGYRLGQNLLTFLCASMVFGAAALAATLAIGLLAPLPALFLLGSESAIARAIAAAAWIAGIAAAAPLLPTWMALLYQRRRAARDGDELAAQIAALQPAGE